MEHYVGIDVSLDSAENRLGLGFAGNSRVPRHFH